MADITYDTGSKPHAPFVRIRITDSFNNLQFGSFVALVDSGADYTCIPKTVVDQVSGYSYDWRLSEEFTGNLVQVKLVRVLEAIVEFIDKEENVVFRAKHANLQLPIVQSGLLGRDILNSYRCVLDGPRSGGKID
jgi:predicted aspartyl protease